MGPEKGSMAEECLKLEKLKSALAEANRVLRRGL